MATLLGQILCELATRGESAHPIGDFSASRTALMDPTFPAQRMI